MVSELTGLIKRQYNNLKIFKAYSLPTLLKELFLFPKDMLSGSGHSSNVLNIALFVTLRCNAKCAMCNVSGLLNDAKMPDIPMDRIERLLDEVKKYHPSIILFGGEPFVRKDIVQIVKAVKSRALTVGMFTNGMLLDENTVNELVASKLDYIAFSLQGPKEVHDRILAIPGAFEKMERSIKLFTGIPNRHTKVIIHSTICEYNINDLENISKLGDALGVDLVRFGHPTFYSAGEESACTSSLKKLFNDNPDVRAMSYIYDIKGKEDLYVKKIEAAMDALGPKVSFTPELGTSELRSWYSSTFASRRSCLFAWRGLFIYPNGDAYPCESISYKMGNVFDEGFDGVWNGPRYMEFRRILKAGLMPACARCCKL